MIDNKDLNKALNWRKQPYQLTLQQRLCLRRYCDLCGEYYCHYYHLSAGALRVNKGVIFFKKECQFKYSFDPMYNTHGTTAVKVGENTGLLHSIFHRQ